MSGEYSVSLLQELLSQRTHWNEEKQELIHQLEISTQQVNHYDVFSNHYKWGVFFL